MGSMHPVQVIAVTGGKGSVLLDAHFHARNIVNPVYFQQALESLPRDTLIVEVGPHQGLLGQIKRVRADFATLGLIKAGAPQTELQVGSALSRVFYAAGYSKHIYAPSTVNRGTRLPLAKRHPDLWNHTRVQKVFDYSDYEMVYTKSADGAVARPTSSNVTSGGFELRYDIGGEHKFLLDHTIQGQPLFPATGHLFSFWNAIGLDKAVNISEFEILQAVPLDPSAVLVFCVHKTGNEYSITNEGNIVARANIIIVQDGGAAAPAPSSEVKVLDATAAAASNQMLDGNSLYNHFKRYGYEYHNTFRLVNYRTLPISMRGAGAEAVDPKAGTDGYAVLNTAVHIIAWLDVMLQLFLDDLRLLRLPTLLKRAHLRPSLLTAALKDPSCTVFIDTATKRLFNEHALFQELHTLPATKARAPCRLVHSVQTFVPLGAHALRDQHTLTQVEGAADWMAAQLTAHLTAHPEQLGSKPWLRNVLAHAAKRSAAATTASVSDAATNPLSAIASHVYADLAAMLNNPLRCISLAPEHEIFYSRDDNRAFASPAGLLEQLVAVVSLRGSVNSHAAIMARALGIPAVMGVSELPLLHWHEQKVIVDGYQGLILLSPTEAVSNEYLRLISEDVALHARYQEEIHLPSQSQCGERFKFMVNSGLAVELENQNAQYTDGVGLYRTEFPFIIRSRFPTEQEQVELYTKVLTGYPGKTVVMRTLDVGGDKALPYFSIIEENPFLGWRGIRLTLDHPEIFLVQIRAMIKANIDQNNLVTCPVGTFHW